DLHETPSIGCQAQRERGRQWLCRLTCAEWLEKSIQAASDSSSSDDRSLSATTGGPLRSAAGSRMSKTAPPSLCADTVPPCRSTIAFTIDNPSPLPPAGFRDASTL